MSKASERKALGETLAAYSLMRVDELARFIGVKPEEALTLILNRDLPGFPLGGVADRPTMVNLRVDPLDACVYRMALERGDDPALLLDALHADQLTEEDWLRLRELYRERPRSWPLKEDVRVGFVYLIEAEGGAVKVGFSEDVARRLIGLQCGSPVRLRVRATWTGTVEDERRLHAALAEHRLHGEWFAPAAAELAEKLMEHRK